MTKPDTGTANPDPRLSLNDSMSIAGKKLCLAHIEILRAHTPGALEGENPEHVHRMRVAIRKLRFILGLWGPRFGKKKTAQLVREMKWFSAILGAVRDADVLAMRFETQLKIPEFSRSFRASVGKELRRSRDESRAALVAALASVRCEEVFSALTALFNRKPLSAEDPPLRECVPELFMIAIKKVARYGGKRPDRADLHPLRIAFKRLRYLAEFFSAFYPGKLEKPLRQLKKYQEILGRYCDAQVAESFVANVAVRAAGRLRPTAAPSMELGGLFLLQRLDAEEHYRRFVKKAASFPKKIRLLRQATLHPKEHCA
jgi:CHAD domain-containing protein